MLAEQTVIGSRAEGQIMAVDATFRSARNFNFVKFLFEPAAVTGRKLDPGQLNRRNSKVRFVFDCDWIFAAVKLEASLSWRSVMENNRFE